MTIFLLEALAYRVPVGSLWLAMGCQAILLFAAVKTSSRIVAVVALCVSIGSLYLAESAFWTAAVHLAAETAGTVSGIMNTAGILGGIASTLLVPVLVQHFGWLAALGSGAAMAILCTLLWWILGHESALTMKPARAASR